MKKINWKWILGMVIICTLILAVVLVTAIGIGLKFSILLYGGCGLIALLLIKANDLISD